MNISLISVNGNVDVNLYSEESVMEKLKLFEKDDPEERKRKAEALLQSYNDAYKSYASTEYNWYTNEWVLRDTTGWVTAHPDYVAYHLDPRNWFNDVNIFMFESLSYSEVHTLEGVQAIINGTHMVNDIDNGDGTILNYSTAFMEIAKKVGASAYHLASRVRMEQGVDGTSAMISGTYPGYEGYYNYFNVKTYGVGNEYIYNIDILLENHRIHTT